MSSYPQSLGTLARWHFIIATALEGAKYLHQIGLFIILTPKEYGILGTTFSLAYLSATLAGLEQGPTLAPHIHTITAHQDRFIFLRRSLFYPQILQHFIASSAVWYLLYTLTTNAILASAGALISLSEGVRCTIRPLVYAITEHHHAAKAEAGISYTYIICSWLMWLNAPNAITSTHLIIGYAAASLYGCAYLLNAGYRAITNNPITQQLLLPDKKDMLRTQASLLLLHLPHNLFSANFIVPFFAYKGGLIHAGLIKIISEVASAIKSILKSSIWFPLNIFSRPTITPNDRYYLLEEIHKATLPLKITLGLIVGSIISMFIIPMTVYTKLMFFCFCGLIIADFLCLPYELLSIHTHTTGIVAGIRLIEVIINSIVMFFLYNWPVLIIGAISITRFTAWQLMAKNAHQPSPSFAAFLNASKKGTTQ